MYSTYFLCSPCTYSGVKTTLKGATFVVESRTYAQIFWSNGRQLKKVFTFFYFFSPFLSLLPFSFSSPFSFLLLFLSSSFLLTPSLVLYDCSYLTRNKYHLQFMSSKISPPVASHTHFENSTLYQGCFDTFSVLVWILFRLLLPIWTQFWNYDQKSELFIRSLD